MAITLSPGARALWMDYRHRIRRALLSMEEADIEEIIDDLERHLEVAGGSDTAALDIRELEAIIADLGSPEIIAAEAGLDSTVQSSNLAWIEVGLAYTSLLLLVLALFWSELALAFVIAAGLIARVVLEQAGILNSALRYPLLPAILINYALLAVALFLWPLGLVLPFAATGGFIAADFGGWADAVDLSSTGYWALAWAVASVLSGLWIVLLGALSRRLNLLARLLFHPFWPDSLSLRARGFRLGGLGLVAGGIVIIALVGVAG